VATGCPAACRARSPRATPLYRLFDAHFEEVKGQWEDRFERRCGFWRGFVDEQVGRYLECGLFENGTVVTDCIPPSTFGAESYRGQAAPPSRGTALGGPGRAREGTGRTTARRHDDEDPSQVDRRGWFARQSSGLTGRGLHDRQSTHADRPGESVSRTRVMGWSESQGAAGSKQLDRSRLLCLLKVMRRLVTVVVRRPRNGLTRLLAEAGPWWQSSSESRPWRDKCTRRDDCHSSLASARRPCGISSPKANAARSSSCTLGSWLELRRATRP